MELEVREFFGLLTAVLILAGLAFIVTNGTQSAAIIGAGSNGYANLVRAATLQKAA